MTLWQDQIAHLTVENFRNKFYNYFMHYDQKHVAELMEDLSRLKGRVRALCDEADRHARSLQKLGSAANECFAAIQQNQEDIFARLENIEAAIFPNLTGDLIKVHRIIGPSDGRAGDRLDRKPPKA